VHEDIKVYVGFEVQQQLWLLLLLLLRWGE
jgi:hypothetical protein